MDIEFKGLDGSLRIDEYAIREVTESFGNVAIPPQQQTRFQALVSGKGISKKRIVCLLKYYDKNNQFLGLDKQEIRMQGKQPVALSVNITVPDGTAKIEIHFELKRDFETYLNVFGLLWGAGIIFIMLLGLNALFDLF